MGRIRSGPGRFSSAIVQFSVPPPVLAMVNGWLVVVLVACVLAMLSGLTSMFGSPPAPPPGIRHHSLTMPVSPPALSLTVSVQSPAKLSPSKAASSDVLAGSPPTRSPAMVGVAARQVVSTLPSTPSSLMVALMLSPEQPKVVAGTPGWSIKVTVVPVSTC